MDVTLGFVYEVAGRQAVEIAALQRQLEMAAEREAVTERRLGRIEAAIAATETANECIGDGAVYEGGGAR